MNAWLLLLGVALIAANGFFVGAEFAVLAARRARLEPLLSTSRRARTALQAIEQLPLMISGCQFGITLASLGLGALGEPVVAELLAGPFEALHLPRQLVHPVSIAVALALVSVLHMLFGEMVPKNLALAGPERAALALAPPLMGFVRVCRPVIVGLTAIATAVLRILKTEPVTEIGDAASRDAVAALIGESQQEGLLNEGQHELLSGAIEFEDRTAASIALPLGSLITVPSDVTPARIEELVIATGFSRFPVQANADGTDGLAGSLIGYLHLTDVLDPERREEPVDRRWIRPLEAVRSTATLATALGALRSNGSHLARVVAEDGSECGLIALEDILEQLVGEVVDTTEPRPPA